MILFAFREVIFYCVRFMNGWKRLVSRKNQSKTNSVCDNAMIAIYPGRVKNCNWWQTDQNWAARLRTLEGGRGGGGWIFRGEVKCSNFLDHFLDQRGRMVEMIVTNEEQLIGEKN